MVHQDQEINENKPEINENNPAKTPNAKPYVLCRAHDGLDIQKK